MFRLPEWVLWLVFFAYFVFIPFFVIFFSLENIHVLENLLLNLRFDSKKKNICSCSASLEHCLFADRLIDYISASERKEIKGMVICDTTVLF